MLLTFVRTCTKDKPHVLHSGWASGSRLQPGVAAILQLMHLVCTSPPVGDIPGMEILPNRPKVAATMAISPETDNLRATVTPPDVSMPVYDVLRGRRRAEPSPLAFLRIVGWARELRCPRASSVRTHCTTEPLLLPIEPDCEICPRAAPLPPIRLPTSPPPWIIGSAWVFCVLTISAPAGRSSGRRRGGDQERLVWNILNVNILLEVERNENAKWRAISSK